MDPRHLLLASLILLPAAGAQPPGAPAYDVVSIRIDARGPGSSGTEVNDATFTATNVTLKDLLEDAFDIRQDLIAGVPGSIDALRFDVRAKIIEPNRDAIHKLSDHERRAMLVPILTERFGLKWHLETRTASVLELVRVKDGPGLKPSASQDSGSEGTSVYDTAIKATDMPIPIFCKTLSHQLHQTVVDRTGLTGNYEIALKWSRDDAPNLPADAPPGFFTALQEQLGLRLQPAKAPVPTLVVDHVERPTDN